MDKVLTICIPTYNRANKLNECLTRIFSLAKSEEVEVIISDNASSDNTQEVAKSWMKKHKNVSYQRQEKNMGPDVNFDSVLRKVQTKYALLLGDDDLLPEGFLEYYIPELTGKDYSFVKVGHYDELKRKKVYQRSEADNFILDVGVFVTFMSTMVFNIEVLKATKDVREYFGSSLYQTKLMFECITTSDLPILLDESYTIITGPNDHVNYSISHVFIYQLNRIIKSCDFKYRTRRKMIKGSIKFYNGWVKHYKRSGYKLLLHFKDLLIIMSYLYGWFTTIPLLCIPTFLVKRRK